MIKHRLDSDMIKWFRQRGEAAPTIRSPRGGDGRTPRSKGTVRRAALLGVILGLGATALTGGARPARAAAILIQSCPFTAMTPGTYMLIRDLTCPAPAITVTANDVSLVLGGHTLTALTPGIGKGVRATDVTGLRIASGTVVGFRSGIGLLRTPGARIAAVTATGNSANGIIVRDSPGARLDGSTATTSSGPTW
jgi:hypothetical protein